MTRKERVLNDLDLLNNALSNGVIVALLGIGIIIAQSQTNSIWEIVKLTFFLIGVGIIGLLCARKRKKYASELESMEK